ncbi:MAG: hypothetical protein WBD16_16340 [Pyrinomonadaceae bacterium]
MAIQSKARGASHSQQNLVPRERSDLGTLGHAMGLGRRKIKLLREFGSIERIAKASADELRPFVGQKTAAEISSHFKNQRKLAAG